MNEIIIVTAFFDIQRENFSVYPRSNNEYFEYFEFWARIRNNIIVYCQTENKQRVLDIRKKFNLEEKTEVICIDDFMNIEKDLYCQMEQIENNKNFLAFRYHDVACSNQAKYDYIMFLKYWCLYNTSQKFGEQLKYAWLDFGYNHGGGTY